jgi:signal transduction histidine kinase
MQKITLEDADTLEMMINEIFDLALLKRNTYSYKDTTFNDVALNKINTCINRRMNDLEHKIQRDQLSMAVFFFNMDQMQKGIFEQANVEVDVSLYSRVIARFNTFIVELSNINHKYEEKMLMQSRLAQMGEMISMIAHQWRQPLGAIASTALNMKLKLELKKFDLETLSGRNSLHNFFINKLDDIENYVENLTTTIDDFRNFYKPNKTRSAVSFNTVVHKVLQIIGSSINNDNIEILEESHDDALIDMHENEMMQVIINILKNAHDNFIEKNITAGEIKIKSKNNALYISDNGGGIPDEILDRIFDPYFSTKDEKNGTGLGLYMSKQIIEKHENGTLTAKNQNNGVLFTITLGSNQ